MINSTSDKKSEFQAKIFDDFISVEDAKILVDFCQNAIDWRSIPNSFWDSRTINFHAIKNKSVRCGEILETAIKKMQHTLIDAYSLDRRPFADTADVVRWFVGMQQHPHADDMSNNQEQHKRFGHRYFGCVIYLNDDYDGGSTFYPLHNFSVKPKAGRLAVHLGDQNHLHGVTKVEKNTRYTFASFWGFDENKKQSGVVW